MVIALPQLHRHHLLHVSQRSAQMRLVHYLLMQHAKHFHINVLRMVQGVYYQAAVILLGQHYLVKELVLVIQDRFV